jgi:hypothetical protein
MTNTPYNNFDFGPYLAGLFEGDGHVAIKDKRFAHPKPTFHITFHKKDLPLAEKLHRLICVHAGESAVGSVFIHKYNNSCVLNIYSVPGLITVVKLINGHLKTPKASTIGLVIDWLNAKHCANLVQKSLCAKPINHSAWLAGFTDADGSFSIDLRLQPRFKLSCQWQLNQRCVYPYSGLSYHSCLSNLADFLCTRLYDIRPKSGNNYYAIKVTSAKSKQILRDYYTRWPLLSSKRQDYLVWCRVDNLIANGCAKSEINQIKRLKQSMNNKRSFFDWSHLEL